MKTSNLKTPLFAAFFLIWLLSACGQDNNSSMAKEQACARPTTAIALVQGSAPMSKMVGQQVEVQGIVTLIESGQGAYIEELHSDNRDQTSNALFLATGDWDKHMQPGSKVMARGTVTEIRKGRNSLTAIDNIEAISICATDQELPLTSSTLPMKGLDREAVEGMRINLPQTLTVTDNYRLNKGQIGVSGNGFQYIATEVTQPGDRAAAHSRENQTYVMPLQLETPSPANHMLLAGTAINDVIGVMVHDDRNLRLSVASMATSTAATMPDFGQSVPDPASANELRVVSINLQNYFNGDGKGAGFPTPRGAETPSEFSDQRDRIGAALHVMKPQLIAVMELENDGFEAHSAAADFVALLDQEAGGHWQAARPEQDNTGSDEITVGLFYRTDVWQAIGAARTLTGPEFDRSRQPIAQVFQPLQGGEPLLLVVNHLKSKGSCPDAGPNLDQKDGQGCWNPMRTASAQKMSAWVNSLARASNVDNIMMMGDMNAYRNEDPINAIRTAGFEELMDGLADPTFSYMYYGQAGTLDYAFVSPSLKQKINRSQIWHANSTMPANMALPLRWMRFSDHDPVIVDLSVRH